MKKHFVFCHGFGFDKDFWKNLAPYFAQEQCTYLDLGYFANSCRHCDRDREQSVAGGGKQSSPHTVLDCHARLRSLAMTRLLDGFYQFNNTSQVLTIGIGHSLGLTKLLQSGQQFDYLIGLNSFINFLGNNADLRKKREVELALLTRHFIKSPLNTMHNFYQRCGVAAEVGKIEKINTAIAINDLQFLKQSFDVPPNIPTLIIGAYDDVIIPTALLHDNFAHYPNVVVQIIANGMHALGLLHADLISQKIKSFVYAAT